MSLQRPYRGSRVSSFYPVKSLPPLASLDSAFQLQEYISLLIRLDVHDVDAIVSLPGKPAQKEHDESSDSPEPDAKKPEDGDRKSDISVDKACWIYEQLRRLAQDLSHPLITMLQQECTRSSCPQMKAGEWLYLCVAHGNDGAMEQCCAIDYILHTVDSATALLNSPRAFPSRLSIPQTSHRHFSSLARRLGRIFAHAYFHHKEAFQQAEAESSLYARFLKLTNYFDLVPAEFLVIPESAIQHDDKMQPEEVEPPRLFSAAVHPTPPNFQQHDTLTETTVADDQASNTRPKAVDPTNHLGMDSPRKLGRSRTDTMVFSEAFSIAEELSRAGDGDALIDVSPVTEEQALSSEQSWPDLQTRAEDLEEEEEDISDARSDLTLTGALSPPVEALSLVSLEDTAGVAMPHDNAVHDTSPPGPAPETLAETIEESPRADETCIPEVAESATEEGPVTTSTELTPSLPGRDESAATSADERDDPIPSPSEEEPEGSQPDAESELPPPSEPALEINEPPPSEPIPPENESDITDVLGGPDGDEVMESGEKEAVVAE